MYSDYVQLLKALQISGYFISGIFGVILTRITAIILHDAFLRELLSGLEIYVSYENPILLLCSFILVTASLCFSTYLSTQSLISIVDLLNQIEINTRPKNEKNSFNND